MVSSSFSSSPYPTSISEATRGVAQSWGSSSFPSSPFPTSISEATRGAARSWGWAEGELELIHTQMTQKPMLRAEGECACGAQMACAKIRGRRRPSAPKRERDLWVVSTLEMHTGRRLICGTRSSIVAEVKNGFSAHRAPSALPPGKCPSRARTPSSAFRVTVKCGGPKNRHHASGPLVA